MNLLNFVRVFFDQAASKTGLEYILGGESISEFNVNTLPTTGEVLRFYSQFWGKQKSDSAKETLVAKALEEFYHSKRIATILNINIRRKVKREVGQLKKILKFKCKTKKPNQIEMENRFKLTLSNTFVIERLSNIESMENSPMEIDEQFDDGILIIF